MLILLTAVLLMLVVPAFSVGNYLKDYVGCYSTDFASDSNYGATVDPFTWKICIHLCANRVTVYAGVQTSKQTCYCGNDIVAHSVKVSNTSCHPCHEDSSKECGGPDTLSLYQLREADPLPDVVLLATSKGVELLVSCPSNSTFTTLIPSPEGASAVAYNYAKNEIYFGSGKRILRTEYVPFLMTYFPPTTIVDGSDTVTNLAVDWVHDKLYWTLYGPNKVLQANLDGTNSSFLPYLYSPRHIAVEPYSRIIFYRNSVKLLKYKNELTKDMVTNYFFNITDSMAIGIHQEQVFLVGSYHTYGKRYLVSVNYDGSSFRVIHAGSQLSDTRAMDVFNDAVVWLGGDSSNQTLYRGYLALKSQLKNLTIIATDLQNIYDMKIYRPEAQTPSHSYACSVRRCSDICSPVTVSLVRCACPESKMLAADARTCIEKVTQNVKKFNGVEESTTEKMNVSETDKEELSKSETVGMNGTQDSRGFVSHAAIITGFLVILVCLGILVLYLLYAVISLKRKLDSTQQHTRLANLKTRDSPESNMYEIIGLRRAN